MPPCSSKTFQLQIVKSNSFVSRATSPWKTKLYYSPPFSFRERATIDPPRHVRPSPPPPPSSLLSLSLCSLDAQRCATVVKQEAGIAVKLLARVSTDRGDVALLSAHAVFRSRQRFTRDDSTAMNPSPLFYPRGEARRGAYFCVGAA